MSNTRRFVVYSYEDGLKKQITSFDYLPNIDLVNSMLESDGKPTWLVLDTVEDVWYGSVSEEELLEELEGK